MMTAVPVIKMNGTGNEFALLDARAHPLADPAPFAIAICKPDSLVQGADGLLLIVPSKGYAVGMQMFNPDGSEAEMCGNGIRCAARYLAENDRVETTTFETKAGAITTHVAGWDPFEVRVSMGVPRLEPARSLSVDGKTFEYRPVSLGNPHAVIFVDDVAGVDLDRFGPAIEHHADFPERTNVHFAQVLDGHTIRAVHWERGAGRTQACGTGAVAVAAAAVEVGRAGSPIDVLVPGGRLRVEWTPGANAVLQGPAEREFERTVPLPA